ncbi:MAG: DNA repair protein RadA [Alphaproteobacteria bacterium]|nr:DNA repair protein RadA [Alphaproteobacteria bacterium]
MARTATLFVCQACGSSHNKWAGKCEACGEWNTIVEEIVAERPPQGLGKVKGRVVEFAALSGVSAVQPRRKTGIEEFDRVTGGGLVAGSAILIGGDPGIGKSTILLQAVALLSKKAKCAYISGEESIDQIRMRALRLGLADASVDLASVTSVRDIISTMDREKFDVVVIDSIQTMYLDNLDSAPGTVAQVRAAAQELIRTAKRRGTCLLIVGHVTKDGQIAGPRVLEHMVDTVLYFEGDRGHTFRILRAVKNRFGPTDEIGVFEMGDLGLQEVTNPSELFLSQRNQEISGSAVFAGMEGTRPVLVEIQALVAPSPLGTPRRAVIGWDAARLAMVLAVLEARCGVQIGPNDVYLNVAGGLRITEPAADLAVAAALVSSLSGVPVPSDMVIFGEIGLSGEIRNVGQPDKRLKEAAKLGFRHALIPAPAKAAKDKKDDLRLTQVRHLKDILPLFTEDT